MNNFDTAFSITPAFLKSEGVAAIILDADNTIREVGELSAVSGTSEWLSSLREAGIKILLLSNNFKSNVRPFAQGLGIDYIAMGLKPLPFGVSRAVRRLGLPRDKIAMIGDQLFTDILAAKLSGVRSYLVKPIREEKNWFWKIRRIVEKSILKNRGNS